MIEPIVATSSSANNTNNDHKDLLAVLNEVIKSDAANPEKFLGSMKALNPQQLNSFLGFLLQDSSSFKSIGKKLLGKDAGGASDSVCKVLFELESLEATGAFLYVLSFVPHLVWSYMFKTAHEEPPAGLEAVLLAVYNHAVRSRRGEVETVSQPMLSMPSVFHTVSTAAPAKTMLTADSLAQHDKRSKSNAVEKPFTPLERVNASTRPRLILAALQQYAENVSQTNRDSRRAFVMMVERICSCGYGFDRGLQQSSHHHHSSHSSKSGSSKAPANARAKSPFDLRGTLKMRDLKREADREKRRSGRSGNVSAATSGNLSESQNHTNPSAANGVAGSVVVNNNSPSAAPPLVYKRIPLDSAHLQQMLAALAYCHEAEDTRDAAARSLTALSSRATEDLLPDVLLAANALKDYLANRVTRP